MDELEKAFYFKEVVDQLIKRISIFIPEAKDYLAIRNVILMAHNTIEGLLNMFLSRYYFGEERERSEKDKVNHFWVNILIEMNFNKKIKILEQTGIFGKNKNIINAFDRINVIRNDVAHYPHRLYKRGRNYLLYKGKHIFKDPKALDSFYEDFDIILKEAFKHSGLLKING